MMAYRTKVTVVTNGKEFKPGAILPADISKLDLDFLKSKKFVEVIDAAAAAYDDGAEDAEDTEDDGDDQGDDFVGFDEINPGAIKSADEIKAIKAKKDVAAYAASIGLDLGDYENKKLKDLQDEVINFQEEQIAESADGDGSGEDDGE